MCIRTDRKKQERINELRDRISWLMLGREDATIETLDIEVHNLDYKIDDLQCEISELISERETIRILISLKSELLKLDPIVVPAKHKNRCECSLQSYGVVFDDR